MSINQLHHISGFSRATLHRWKTNRVIPTGESKKVLADIFNVSIDYFNSDPQKALSQKVLELEVKVNRLEKEFQKIYERKEENICEK